MKHIKPTIFALVLALLMMLSLSACGSSNKAKSTIFPSVDADDIPDTLEKTVGTLGDTFSTFFQPTDENDYQAYLSITFEDTTKFDYTSLIEHYELTSTGTDNDGSLLFDWGWIQIVSDVDSIQVSAYLNE